MLLTHKVSDIDTLWFGFLLCIES